MRLFGLERGARRPHRLYLGWGVVTHGHYDDYPMTSYDRFWVYLAASAHRTVVLWRGRQYNARVYVDDAGSYGRYRWLITNLLPVKIKWLESSDVLHLADHETER